MARPTSGSAGRDPRLDRSRQRVLQAAIDLLCEHGAAGLTIEAVAARSGVAKTTIYRQFAGRDELHVAAVESLGSPPPLPGEGDLLADVTAWVSQLHAALYGGPFGALFPTIIDGAERSPHLAELAHALVAPRRGVLITRLEAAVDRGELVGPLDADLLSSQLVGPLFYRRFISRQPTSPEFVADLVAATLRPHLSD